MTSVHRWWTPERMSSRSRLDDVGWTGDGLPVWLEGRSDRSTLMTLGPDGIRELTPSRSVRAGVGYGGGDFAAQGDRLYFVERGGPLFRQDLDGSPAVPVLPRFGSVASPAASPDGKWILCVHDLDGTDLLALAPTSGDRWPVDLVRGADFYMQPTWHPDSRGVAWVEWDHPRMPWDGARLMEGRLAEDGRGLHGIHLIAGDDAHAVFQPCWSRDGSRLAWIESDGEMHLLRLRDERTGLIRTLLSSPALLPPAWVQGMRSLAWSPSGTLWVLDARLGRGRIWQVDGDSIQEVDTGPYRAFSQISASPVGETFLVLVSAPDLPDRVARFEDGVWTELAVSVAEPPPAAFLPTCESVSWRSGTDTVHGLLFKPRGQAPAAGWPLLVNVHGGPTSQRAMSFSADTCFFADQGWAVLEVNYRGSTGYGESYRRALDGQWGILDVRDCVEGAKAVVSRGGIDARRLVVKGGSAGGFTVLNALARHPGFFRAGISNYGVGDLVQLEKTTHKFEAKYLHGLVGPYPEREDLFVERSPVHQARNFRDPLAIFQGSDDKVVPPDQAQRIAQALVENGVPHHYRVFQGEGHGWRKTESVLSYYADVEAFLAEHAS